MAYISRMHGELKDLSRCGMEPAFCETVRKESAVVDIGWAFWKGIRFDALDMIDWDWGRIEQRCIMINDSIIAFSLEKTCIHTQYFEHVVTRRIEVITGEA